MDPVDQSINSRLAACRGRRGSYLPPPRTDPGVRYYRTGLFRQPRFRNTLFNSASMLFPAVKFALLFRLCMSGQGFLYGLRLPVSPFPRQIADLPVIGPTVSEYYWLIRLPKGHQHPYNFSLRVRLPAHGAVVDKNHCTHPWQEPFGSPKFLTSLSTHATLFLDPGRPSGGSPKRPLCVGFWRRYTIAICIILSNEAVSRLQGLRSPLRPLWFPVYASAVSFGYKTSSTSATLGTGGWLGLTRQGLTPCKKRQASWRTTASS